MSHRNWALRGPKNPHIMKLSAKSCESEFGSLKNNNLRTPSSSSYSLQSRALTYTPHENPKKVGGNRTLWPNRRQAARGGGVVGRKRG